MTYRKLADLMAQRYETTIRASIYLEIKHFEDDNTMSENLIDKYIDYGYNYWSNTEYMEPTKIGLSLFYGLDHIFNNDNEHDLDINNIQAVFDYGFNNVVLDNYYKEML